MHAKYLEVAFWVSALDQNETANEMILMNYGVVVIL
jgi:hypothetical protein